MPELFSEFNPTTAADWKAQIVKELRGEAYESLTWKNENGFEIQPFYTTEDLKQQYDPAFTHATWEICVKGKFADATELNKQFLKQLEGGASSISVFCKNIDLETALKNIELNYIQSTFYVDENSAGILKTYLEKNYDVATLQCSIFYDTLNSEEEFEKWMSQMGQFEAGQNIKTVSFDALDYHNLNCLAYYEVAIILSGINAYLGKLSDKKLSVVSPFVIKTGVSADYFMQISKLRAIKRLWQLLKIEYGITNGLHVIVETGLTNKSISDSYNNLVRTTVESMAAVAGGCNELIVTEFDTLFSVNQNLSERLAINQQLILKEESYLDKMADVSCGSYYIERITDLIATEALETMKRFEKNGGYFKCLESNLFITEISQQASEKAEKINNKSQIVIGVNKFRNEKESIRLSAAKIKQLEHLPMNNPVLNFELENYFKPNA